MTIDERTDLAVLAQTVKKKVNGLIGVYSLLILLTILLFLLVTVIVALILWGLYVSDALYTRLLVYGLLVIGAAGYGLVVVLNHFSRYSSVLKQREKRYSEMTIRSYLPLLTKW